MLLYNKINPILNYLFKDTMYMEKSILVLLNNFKLDLVIVIVANLYLYKNMQYILLIVILLF